MSEPAGFAGIDAARAASFLTERLGGGVGEVAAFQQQGEWSRAFAFRHHDRELVVRFSALEEDFAKDRLAVRYGSPALPIPRVVELGEGLGGFYAISERLYGEYIDGVDEAQMRSLLPALFAALDAMRLADVSDFTGYGGWDASGNAAFGSWRDFLVWDVAPERTVERLAGWRERMEGSPTGAGPFDAAFARLRQVAEQVPEDRHLIHSDLLHFNVLVQDAQITAVLDWGCGLYGDFLFDVAWFCFWAPWFPAWQRIDFRAETLRHYAEIGLAVPQFEERLLACQLYIGLSGQAYQAFTKRWDDLDATARHTLKLATGEILP
jgi:hygromycin-B 4-O-kinase